MAEDKETIEFVDVKPEKKEHRNFSLKDVITGSMLKKQFVVRQLPFILFLTFLAILYIGNRYHAEKLVRETLQLQNEIKDLRAEALTVSANLMYISKQSEVIRLINERGLGLEESRIAPVKIYIKKDLK